MFTGLSAFPLTPVDGDRVDEAAFIKLIEKLAAAKVASIGALGSTGNYMYLTRAERQRVAELAVAHAGAVPVIVCIGTQRTRDVLALAEDAQKAGARGLLLPPVSYQKLTAEEVAGLFDTVTRNISVPLCVYDNPGTTHFNFDEQLYARIAAMPNVASIKLPGISNDRGAELARIQRLRSLIPSHVTLGISGDGYAANGLNAGCDAWYSVFGGLFPHTALMIIEAAQMGDADTADAISTQLAPFWAFNQRHGSLRVAATAAEILGLVTAPCLPGPLLALQGTERTELAAVMDRLQLA